MNASPKADVEVDSVGLVDGNAVSNEMSDFGGIAVG